MRTTLRAVFAAFAVVFITSLAMGQASAAGFNQNDIIDDSVFDSASSMSAPAIDNFLNGFSGSCISPNSGFKAIDPIGYNPSSGFQYGGFVTAGQVIYDSAQTYSINPQVLITTLEKEQSLVTGQGNFSGYCNNGEQHKYAAAVGYGCPDSGTRYSYSGLSLYQRNGVTIGDTGTTCVNSASKAGFSQQVIRAAWLLKFGEQRSEGNVNWAVIKGDWDNSDDPQSCYGGPMTQGTFARCASGSATFFDGYTTIDGVSVHMNTGATAALYWYTPHFHGNQNFFSLYTQWFGPTTSLLGGVTMSIVQQPDLTPARGETVTYTYSLTNTFTVPITLDGVGAVGRLGALNGANRDLGWQGPVTLQPNTTQQFTFTSALSDTGTMYVWPAVLYQGTYVQYNNWGSTLNIHAPNFTLSQPLLSSPSSVYAGQNVTFTATLKNNETHSISYAALGIPVKLNGSANYDATWVGPGVIGAGQEIALSGTRNLDQPGPFTYWVSDYFNGAYSTIGAVKSLTANKIAPNFSVSGLSFADTPAVQGQAVSATFTVTNNLPIAIDVSAVGVVGRLGTFNGANRDIKWEGPVHFNAGETKTFTEAGTMTETGTHYYWVGVQYGGGFMQYNNWGSTVNSVSPNFSVSGLNFSSTTPAQGQTLSASFSVTNNLAAPVDVDAVGVIGRLGTFNGANRDIKWEGPVHFNAGETKSFTEAGTVTEAGTHYYWIGVYDNGGFMQYNNWGSTIISH